MGRALDPERHPSLSYRYGLTFSHTDGTTATSGNLDEHSMRTIWARWVDRKLDEGYTWVQTSEDSGCAFKAGSTINVELVLR